MIETPPLVMERELKAGGRLMSASLSSGSAATKAPRPAPGSFRSEQRRRNARYIDLAVLGTIILFGLARFLR